MRLLADHCDLYNAALEERREAWRVRKVSISYGMQSAQLRDIRRADPDGQGREKKTRGYPRFKRYQRFSQVMFVAGDGAKWVPSRGRRWAQAVFQAVGSVKVRQHRQVTGTVKTLQLKQEHRRKARARPASGNCKRLRCALAKEHRKVRNRRRDFHHKTARALVNSCDAIGLEDLNTAGMTRRPYARPDGQDGWLPNGAAAKAGLAKSILDAGWAQFTSILAAKAEEAGRRVILVNPAYTSIDCHACG